MKFATLRSSSTTRMRMIRGDYPPARAASETIGTRPRPRAKAEPAAPKPEGRRRSPPRRSPKGEGGARRAEARRAKAEPAAPKPEGRRPALLDVKDFLKRSGDRAVVGVGGHQLAHVGPP